MTLDFYQTPLRLTTSKDSGRHPFYALQKAIWQEVNTQMKDSQIKLQILTCEKYLPESILNRLYSWIRFFDQYTHITGLYDHMIPVLLIEFRKESLLTEQTTHEFNLSCRYLQLLLQSKPNLCFENTEHAKWMLRIILLMAKYPGMVRVSPLKTFSDMSWSLSDTRLLDLFIQLFGKYPLPAAFLNNFLVLNSNEIGAIMHIMRGHNIRTYYGLPAPLSKKESYYLIEGPSDDVGIEDNILVRLTIWSKLAVSCQKDLSMAERLLSNSKAFELHPQEFLENIDYWKQALQILVKAEASLRVTFEATDFIDFFEYKKQDKKEVYSLKRRTPLSIFRDMESWHNSIQLEEIANLTNVCWQGLGLKPFKTTYEGCDYVINEITDRKSLYIESYYLKHCASSYAQYCERGHSAVFSLKKKCEKKIWHLVTIEVKERIVVQARGFSNSILSEVEKNIVSDWAKRNSLAIVARI